MNGANNNRKSFCTHAIQNITQMFQIGMRDSRHFLPAFLKTFHIHTINRTIKARLKIVHKTHPKPDHVP